MDAPAAAIPGLIIHLDYDAFYCSVVEADDPALKFLPMAVQQKQIIVTCNYEARKRGLHKLQLVKEAKRMCPDLVIVLGEDLTRFRDASKALYRFVRAFSWNSRVERLGFDEVSQLWMDVTDQIDYNLSLLNPHNLAHSFFHLSRDDPTHGFAFDATTFAGTTFPSLTSLSTESPRSPSDITQTQDSLSLRLKVASHLARFLRSEIEHQKNYTATAGISTNKLLSKLVGNLNKPNGQTTLLPPYSGEQNNVTAFLDDHDIGKIPGIGFKLAQKLREFVLHRPAAFDDGLVYGGTRETVKVGDVRTHPDLDADRLEKVLSGPGSPHGIGLKVWGLLHGADYSEVRAARDTPKQISIEDSYLRLDTFDEVVKELRSLAISLLKRMHADLLEEEDEHSQDTIGPDSSEQTQAELPAPSSTRRRWMAHPATLRLSTRPRPPLNADGTRTRTFTRISRSAPVPNFVFSLSTPIESLAERLVNEALLPLFRRLHPEKTGWNLSLVNVAVANMAEAGGNAKSSVGQDIANMFRKQKSSIHSTGEKKVLPADEISKMEIGPAEVQESIAKLGYAADATISPVEEAHSPPQPSELHDGPLTDFIPPDARTGSEDMLVPTFSKDSRSDVDSGERDDVVGGDGDADDLGLCVVCGATMPSWALAGHARFHSP